MRLTGKLSIVLECYPETVTGLLFGERRRLGLNSCEEGFLIRRHNNARTVLGFEKHGGMPTSKVREMWSFALVSLLVGPNLPARWALREAAWVPTG